MPILTSDTLPSREELATIGEKARAFYEPLRAKLEKNHWGEYIVIHPDNGDYEISKDYWEAAEKMRERHPNTLFNTIRIGYRAFAHFGGRGASDGKRT